MQLTVFPGSPASTTTSMWNGSPAGIVLQVPCGGVRTLGFGAGITRVNFEKK